uniref:Uncharacterized protein n=1 Tax=Anguilla anguilla TaxID=7936 RepID=A0A0E9SKI0_ANGAN
MKNDGMACHRPVVAPEFCFFKSSTGKPVPGGGNIFRVKTSCQYNEQS